jgi:protein-S-isoprenylcysteine O-methyltransferase Ste14
LWKHSQIPLVCGLLVLVRGGPAGLIGFGTLFFLRVGREEALMIETFGDEYRRYMARTARILPGVY